MAKDLTQDSARTLSGRLTGLRPWPKGISGNPGGRPRSKPFYDALRAAATPEKLKALAEVLVEKAKKGDIEAIKLIADRLDGKVPLSERESEEGARKEPVVFVSGGFLANAKPDLNGLAKLPDAEVEGQ